MVRSDGTWGSRLGRQMLFKNLARDAGGGRRIGRYHGHDAHDDCRSWLVSRWCLSKPGEGKVVWTADESQAFAYVQELVRAWREGRECMDWRREQATDLPGYSVAKVEWRDGETVVTSGRTSRRMFRPGHCLVYLTPSKSGSDSRRAFCVRGDGVAARTATSGSQHPCCGRSPST